MQLTLLETSPFAGAASPEHSSLIVLPAASGEGVGGLGLSSSIALPDACVAALADARTQGAFRGAAGDELSMPNPNGVGTITFLGVGDPSSFAAEDARVFAGRAVRIAERLRRTGLILVCPPKTGGDEELVRAVAEGLVLGAWVFRELQAPDPEGDFPEVRLASIWAPEVADTSAQAAMRLGRAAAEGENLARRLQALPGNRMTPSLLAEAAEEMAGQVGLGFEAWGPDRLLEERMHALLSVSKGSDEEPRLIILRHNGGPEGQAPVALVGKGLTFDAGGISLKPPKGMEDMKYDMSGGAAVVGAMMAIAKADLPVNVLGVVPSSENLMNGRANKPGDVIDSRLGKTIEVINTDAEGRLILADALAWTVEQNPQAIVDCATLTGACVLALGNHASGLFSVHDELVEELRAAGDRSGERCWPLPLWDVYRKQLDSPFADLKNVGGRPAGSITAGRFLQEFVGDSVWAHLDVAGTAYGESPKPYLRKGGYGVPTRLLFEWVRSRSA